MPKNWYREALEAIGMRGRRATIHNRLNAVIAHSDDAKLRSLASTTLVAFAKSSTNPDHTSIADMQAVPSAKLEIYCRERAYPSQENAVKPG